MRTPAVSVRSFTRIGTPVNGPCGSGARAVATACSKQSVTRKLSRGFDRLDARDRGLGRLDRGQLAGTDRGRLCERVDQSRPGSGNRSNASWSMRSVIVPSLEIEATCSAGT